MLHLKIFKPWGIYKRKYYTSSRCGTKPLIAWSTLVQNERVHKKKKMRKDYCATFVCRYVCTFVLRFSQWQWLSDWLNECKLNNISMCVHSCLYAIWLCLALDPLCVVVLPHCSHGHKCPNYYCQKTQICEFRLQAQTTLWQAKHCQCFVRVPSVFLFVCFWACVNLKWVHSLNCLMHYANSTKPARLCCTKGM